MTRMRSKYPGSCSICGHSFGTGTDIDYDRNTRSAAHWTCKAEEVPLPENITTYDMSGGSGYGYNGWKQGEVIASPKRRQEKDGWPEFLYVLRARQQYVREDGMSFGVGDDSGYLYMATCRMATTEEAAPVVAAKRKSEIKKAARDALQAIKKQIRETGEYPHEPESIVLNGERLFDTQTIYGGGDWLVITPEHIWYVQNNGRDGDNWSHNNIRTGGAGAIGWRVPRAQELATKLYELRDLLQ